MNGEIPAPVDDPWPELRAKWEKHEEKIMKAAINDPMVQTLAGILPHCTGMVTPGRVLDQLDEYVSINYPDIRSYYYTEIFMNAADIFMQREAELNGEA